MQFRSIGAGLVTALLISACSRNDIEAVNLANEGDTVMKNGGVDEAISKYEQAVSLDGQNHRIMWKLANAYKKKEQWDKVATASARAAKITAEAAKKAGKEGGFANYYFLQGYALKMLAEKGASWAEAKEPLMAAAKLDPNLADAFFELAEVQLHLDDEQEALRSYTKAIETKPDELPFYGPLADLYIRLGYYEQAELALKDGLAYAKDGDKGIFQVRTLLGEVKEFRGDIAGAITEFESAKKACGLCNEKGQQIAYYNLGYAYSRANPPRKNEAIQQLGSFSKTICRGAAAKRYEDECSQAQEIVRQLGGTLQ